MYIVVAMPILVYSRTDRSCVYIHTYIHTYIHITTLRLLIYDSIKNISFAGDQFYLLDINIMNRKLH